MTTRRWRRPRLRPVMLGLSCVLLLSALWSATLGSFQMSPWRILGSIVGHLGYTDLAVLNSQEELILWSIRLPRIALAGLVGAALASSGVAMQGVVRNPLADPSLIGVANGAAAGAVAFLVLGAPLVDAMPTVALWLLPGCAFTGAIVASLIALRLARVDGELSTAALLLGGVGLAALAGAATGMMVFIADDAQLRSITFWNLGSTAGASWQVVVAVAIPVTIALTILPRWASELDRLLLGETEARHLGVDVQRTVIVTVLCTALAVGAAVASCGVIGFIGLVVPHLLRGWLGPSHRPLLFAAMLGGATLLIIADAIARTVVAPTEIPVGVVTAIIGAPLLLALVHRRRLRIVASPAGRSV
jgi:iron complex transport system permease protein